MTVQLKRSLSLTLLTLYGAGTIIGAGIYVLLGKAAGLAGMQTPLAYLLAAIVVLPTALSFAELASRYPKSAGEAAYVRAGLPAAHLPLIVGLMVVAAGSVSAASVSVGSAGYIQTFLPQLPKLLIILTVVVVLGGLAAWGIAQSVAVAAILTTIEIGGLVMIIVTGLPEVTFSLASATQFFIPKNSFAWHGVFSAGILAFYAFIGFEDMVNVAEEVKQPHRNLPLGIILALLLTTFFYLLVAMVAVSVVSPEELQASDAPLGLVFSKTTHMPVQILNGIGVMAALNGILVQLIMASRILYGMSKQGALPTLFASVNPVTRTPLKATVVVTVAVLMLALLFPIEKLARWTSLIALSVFSLCNLSLIRIKLTQPAPTEAFTTPMLVPVLGLVTSLAFLFQEVTRQLAGG